MIRLGMMGLLLLPVLAGAQVRMTPDTALRSLPVRLEAMPADGATKQYGFFCRQELRWDRKLPVPVRFRLGSQEICDKLEGKQR